MIKKVFRIFFVLICLAVVFALGIGYLLLDNRTVSFVTQKMIARYFPEGQVTYGAISGNLAEGLIFKNVVISNDPNFPTGTVLRIQELAVAGSIFGERWFQVKIDNGRLKLPVSDVVLINGGYARGQVTADIYSPGIDLSEVREIFSRLKIESLKYSGRLEQVDIKVEGTLPLLKVQGKFLLPILTWERLTAIQGEGKVELNARVSANPRFDGVIDLSRGEILGPKTAVIKLKPSQLIFKGDLFNPVLSLKGRTKVSAVVIDASLSGTPLEPQLYFTSDPALPQDQLLVMVATNKSWQGTGKDLGQGVPVDLAKDFIDYFAFGGLGSALGKKLGILGFSVNLDGERRGFDLQKEVTEKMSATYGYEESLPQSSDNPFTKHKMGGQYKINETTTVGVERSVQQTTPSAQDTQKPLDEKIMLKIKKGF